MATNGDMASQLYWMALAALTTEGKYTKMTPQEVHEVVAKLVKDVYGEEERKKKEYGDSKLKLQSK